jgi:hypothetical protein
MSAILTLALAGAVGAASPSPHYTAVDRATVIAALRAPQRAPKGRAIRYCVTDTISTPGAMRRVCRTRADWRALGVAPLL